MGLILSEGTCATDGCLAIDYMERIEELAGKVERYESALKDIAAHPYDCGNLCMGVAQQALAKED